MGKTGDNFFTQNLYSKYNSRSDPSSFKQLNARFESITHDLESEFVPRTKQRPADSDGGITIDPHILSKPIET